MATEDIFDNQVLCSKCNIKTRKISITKNGFTIRVLECPNCGKHIYHPADLQEYENFNKLKNREFEVKLRMVGNSYAVSIPREIIEFQEEMEKEMQSEIEHMEKMVKLCLEQPGKLSLFFTRESRDGKMVKKEQRYISKNVNKPARKIVHKTLFPEIEIEEEMENE